MAPVSNTAGCNCFRYPRPRGREIRYRRTASSIKGTQTDVRAELYDDVVTVGGRGDRPDVRAIDIAVEEIVTKCSGLFVMLLGNVPLDDSAGVDNRVGHRGRSSLYRASRNSRIRSAVLVVAASPASMAPLNRSLVATVWPMFRDSRRCSSFLTWSRSTALQFTSSYSSIRTFTSSETRKPTLPISYYCNMSLTRVESRV